VHAKVVRELGSDESSSHGNAFQGHLPPIQMVGEPDQQARPAMKSRGLA